MPIAYQRFALPLPSFTTYLVLSVAIFCTCLVILLRNCKLRYAFSFEEVFNETNETEPAVSDPSSNRQPNINKEAHYRSQTPLEEDLDSVCRFFLQGAWLVTTLLCSGYCILFLLGKAFQVWVFGSLRQLETQSLKERFWHYVFHKFIFIFGILNVHSLPELVGWLSWFSLLGSLNLGQKLCFDRFEYLSSQPPASADRLMKKVFGSTIFINFTTTSMMVVSFLAYRKEIIGAHMFAFLLAECLIVLIGSMFTSLRFLVFWHDMDESRFQFVSRITSSKDLFVYHISLTNDVSTDSIDLMNHMHMLVWDKEFLLSVSSFIVILQIRRLYRQLKRRLKRHYEWWKMVRNIDARLQPVGPEDLIKDGQDQKCSICWDPLKLNPAKKLPCSHVYHSACLRAWLQNDMVCPVCRLSLAKHLNPPAPVVPMQHPPVPHLAINPPSNDTDGHTDDSSSSSSSSSESNDGSGATASNSGPTLIDNPPVLTEDGPLLQRRGSSFFFNPTRYLSWLPTVELRTNLAMSPEDEEQAARQIHAIFPHISMSAIMADLAVTGSADATVENALSNLLHDDDDDDLSPDDQPSQHFPSSNYPTTSSSDLPSTSVPLPLDDQLPCTSNSILSQAANEPLRFSKNPDERQSILQSRKATLLRVAKRTYIQTGEEVPTVVSSNVKSCSNKPHSE